MVSQDFKDLMARLFKKRQRIETFTINLNSDGTGQVHMSFKGSTDTFSSSEPDVVNYAFHLKKTIDADGNFELVEFKDLEKYYRDVEFLFGEEKNKIRQAYRDLRESRYIFTFDPDELVEEFLLSDRRKSKEFSKLKSDHFYIVAHCMSEAARAHNRCQIKESEIPIFGSYSRAIQSIYAKGFRIDPNFIKNYIWQKTTHSFNIEIFAMQVRVLTKYNTALRATFPEDGMSDEHGMYPLLETYRRYAEGCVKPLNFLRIAQELSNGATNPDETKNAQENRAILQPVLGSMLDCYDPRLRNGESHLSTEIDTDHDQVLLFKEDNGKRKLIKTYSFVEIMEMSNTLQNILYPALAFSTHLELRAMLLLIIQVSPEYKSALLKIEN